LSAIHNCFFNIFGAPPPPNMKVISSSQQGITHLTFLAYFPKKKVGLSNHQSVCLSVCVSHS
jgi:hypothetical protein